MIHQVNIPTDHIEIMVELLQVHPGRDFDFYISRLERLLPNITETHWISLGFLIGHSVGRHEERQQLFNNLLQCKEN